jgi:N-acetylglucosamine-6-phosphate deacetylase
MAIALTNARVLIPSGILEQHTVVIVDGIIEQILPSNDFTDATIVTHDCQGQLLLPGFIDVQVNGGGGVLFNDNPTIDGIKAIAAAHRKYGTTGLLPTLISDDLDIIACAIKATDAALLEKVPGILGLHIEGPFISNERKGTHNENKFRVLDKPDVALLSSLAYGKTLVTLAPERNNMALIHELVDAGVIVSAGHTNATCQQTQQALKAGITGFTHLFNAMSPLNNREPGVVGAALFDQNSWCGIIVDGHHVDPINLKIALRCKPLDRFILVTDSMPNLGTDAIDFKLQGKTVHVRDGKCVDDNGVLSGSVLDMAGALRNAISLLNVSLTQASQMASTNPAEFLGLGHRLGKIAIGYQADLVLLNNDLAVINTWIAGK